MAKADTIKRLVFGANALSFDKQLKGGQRTDVVYELWVNLSALAALQNRWSLRLENTTVPHEIRLPISPAKKANFPYFVASNTDGTDAFQICMGTEISTQGGDSFAPDLSIQSAGATLDPNGNDVAFCWDQKYTESENRLSRDEVVKFSGYLNLVVPALANLLTPFEEDDSWPNQNALITNADFSTLSDASLAEMGIVEVASVNVGCAATRRP